MTMYQIILDVSQKMNETENVNNLTAMTAPL